MTIEMNIDYLLKNKVTANEFLILQLLIEKQNDRLIAFQNVVGMDAYNSVISSLQEKEFVETVTVDENEELQITEKCLRTFKGKGYFEEFYMLFPVSVIRPDGKRESLRTARKQCEKKYRGTAKRKDIHEHIMKCLEFEIEERQRTDSLKYMKKMPNWLSSEVWREYDEKMRSDSVIDNAIEEIYGTEII